MIASDEILTQLLDDDVGFGDLTTASLNIGGRNGRLEFRARQTMTVCASEEAARLFFLAGADAQLEAVSGSVVPAGRMLVTAQGSATSLHRTWKTAQTLVEWASGISSAAAAIVAAARPVPVACTRKSVPGTKALSVKAVRAGGATMHRLGLSETLLVFHEHRLFLHESPATTLARLRAAEPEKKVVVEVGSVEDALVWAGADVLQLEKFSPEQVTACRAALAGLNRRPLLAAAGGIRADNAAAYVAAGADLLVTSAPYTAPPRDVQVVFFALP
jgi:molybdenum transport protein